MNDQYGPGTTLVVIGAGTMGSSIATLGVAKGLTVRLVDTNAESLDSAANKVPSRVARMSDTTTSLGVLSTHTDLTTALDGADVVIEAVPEIPTLKQQIFVVLAQHAAPATLLATNTSTLSVADIARSAGDSPRVIGMHFFNPAHRMELVEVIKGPATSDASTSDATELCTVLGKTPIVVTDTPGFVTSRLGLILGNEAMRIVQDGVATAADVDTALRLGYNHPMGPLELADLVGLDARLNNLRSVADRMDRPEFAPPQILIDLVDAGRLGRKSGHGFYEYSPDQGQTA